ncbi:Inositol-1-monophosphatase [Defluviimonas aquaemixtae]|uniref:Inositol-1-monophosphatase n=1 Tax=Albidovulum aquaemixtae TaxID=1542388 RepID=A0A2R8B2J1_9RHOB|nr:inositol monophosphatase family protein [Defluviimonas aquaemixtae]SPH16797.1 Inositol-1-monophosphatase [Defluviimonas aquaemixtae]
MNAGDIDRRYAEARRIAQGAGGLALEYFRRFDGLNVEVKSHQDFVSEADRNVEAFVREALVAAFPDDAIVGEEDAPKAGTSGFTWVIDPIDGTTNFIHGIPGWTVVLAGVAGTRTEVGVIHDPNHDEMFHCRRGQGAFCNDRQIGVLKGRDIHTGSVGVGFSGRTRASGIKRLVPEIIDAGGVFYRNASGALSLAYVASGKLLGYVEEHMNAWDCLAGQLLVAEAGGVVEDQNAATMVAQGGRVIVGAPEVFDGLLAIAERAFGSG